MTKQEFIELLNISDEDKLEIIEFCLDSVIQQEIAEEKEKTCTWNELSTVAQFTECGIEKNDLWKFTHRKNFSHCPYCGRKIERV